MKTPLAVLLGGMVASTASAAPRAESATECGIAADMAVVARSLAEEQVQRPQAGAIMASGQKFAEELFATCMKTGGNMDTVLGRRL